jgi:hypothetical protein
MNHTVQTQPSRFVGKDLRTQDGSIDSAVRPTHTLTEKVDDRVHSRATRPFKPVNNVISVKNVHSQLTQLVGKETLAACNAARYGNPHDHSDKWQTPEWHLPSAKKQ